MHLLVIDTETGGLDPLRHPLLEIGAVLVNECLDELGRFQALVRPYPGSTIDPESLSITGIDQETLNRDGMPEARALEGLLGFVSGPLSLGEVILAGWNVSFDQAVLNAAFHRQDKAWPFGHRSLDIQSVWAFVNRWDFGGLTRASQRLFNSTPPHRAMSDAMICLEVLRACYLRSTKFTL